MHLRSFMENSLCSRSRRRYRQPLEDAITVMSIWSMRQARQGSRSGVARGTNKEHNTDGGGYEGTGGGVEGARRGGHRRGNRS
jgi:hypothetical protein